MPSLFDQTTELIGSSGPLRASDIERYRSGTPDTSVENGDLKKTSSRHHRIARMAALGCFTNREIAARCNFTEPRVSLLLHMPAIQQLVGEYQEKIETDEDMTIERIKLLRDSAIDNVQGQLDSDLFRGKDLTHLLGTILDRTGLPAQKEVNIRSTNVDVASILKLRDSHWEEQADIIVQEALAIDDQPHNLPSIPVTPLIEETLDALFSEEKDQEPTLGGGN